MAKGGFEFMTVVPDQLPKYQAYKHGYYTLLMEGFLGLEGLKTLAIE